MTTTRTELTNLLKKAQKTTWYGTDHLPVTFGFVYHHPGAVDWEYSGSESRALYLEINGIITAMCFESYGTNTFTDCQSRILEL